MVSPVESILGVPVISLFCGELSLSHAIKGGCKQFFLLSITRKDFGDRALDPPNVSKHTFKQTIVGGL